MTVTLWCMSQRTQPRATVVHLLLPSHSPRILQAGQITVEDDEQVVLLGLFDDHRVLAFNYGPADVAFVHAQSGAVFKGVSHHHEFVSANGQGPIAVRLA